MGVRGLFGLINDNQSVLLTEYKLHDTKLIIDGSNLYHSMYHFYHVRDEFGGDYNHYATGIRKYFRRLRACNVEPYVVLDGGYDPDDRKLQTVLQRKAQRRERAGVISEGAREDTHERVLPVLAEETFRQVLTEIGVPHVSCPYEADREIATLASRWQCPVFSNDGDFFIFRLEGGVLPLSYGDTNFINMELMINDKATGQSRRHVVVDENEEVPLALGEFMYIEAKLYKYQRLLERVQAPPDFLPMFATFSGNDYVDKSKLGDFYFNVCKQFKDKPLNLKAKPRMIAVLHWAMGVRSDEEALKYAIGFVEDKPPISRNTFRNAVLYSLASYRDIGEFVDMDLETYFKHYNQHVSIDDVIKLKKLPDHVTKVAMPEWSSKMLRSCKMANSFVQNVAVNHRVIFDCQIEVLENPSSYKCSRPIRSVLYAVVTTFKGQKKKASKGAVDALVDTGGSRNSCVEEIDRKKADREKVYVKPTTTVTFGSTKLDVPSLEKVPEIDMAQARQILFATLGLTPEIVETLGEAEDPVPAFVVGVLYFWFRNADPEVSPVLVKAIILCIVRLHLGVVESVVETTKPSLIPSLAFAINMQFCENYKATLPTAVKEWMSTMESGRLGDRKRTLVHGLAQFQACYLNATFLNQALMSPVHPPDISALFNCTVICNMCMTLERVRDFNKYLANLFTADSPLYELVTRWCDVITTNPDKDATAASKGGKASATGGKEKKGPKHAGKHRK